MKTMKISSILFFCILFLNTCEDHKIESDKTSVKSTIDTLIASEIPRYYHIGKKRIDEKDSEYYPKNDTMVLKFTLDGPLKKFEKQLRVEINTKDSNCIFSRINENDFKLYIDEKFSKDEITFNVNLSPKKNCIVVNDGYKEDKLQRKYLKELYGADHKSIYYENDIIPVQEYMHKVRK